MDHRGCVLVGHESHLLSCVVRDSGVQYIDDQRVALVHHPFPSVSVELPRFVRKDCDEIVEKSRCACVSKDPGGAKSAHPCSISRCPLRSTLASLTKKK